jgi:hypothetical protein
MAQSIAAKSVAKSVAASVAVKQNQPQEFKAKRKKIIPPPSLIDLNKFLEDANTHPQDCMEHLTYLNECCEEVLLKVDLLDQYFVPGKSDDEI